MQVINQGAIATEVLNPQELGLSKYGLDALKGGDVEENASILRQVLQGKGTEAQTDVVALNAGLALYTSQTVDSYEAGIKISKKVLQSGSAWEKLEQLAAFGQSV